MAQQAKWIGKTQGGEIATWAGDGSCTILSYESAAAGFGIGGEPKGPAVLVQFHTPGKWTAWLPQAEIAAP